MTDQDLRRCTVCGGNGVCDLCHGTGQSNTDQHGVCFLCKGTKRCKVCDGSGKVPAGV